MLQFILGRASSGKTYNVTQRIAECVSQGENPVLLVPEQFSFESEKNILDVVGDTAAQKVSVISFTRLCDEIERIAGGVCGESITNADRIILMGKAIKSCQNELVRFKKYANSRSFASLMIDTIGEFKMNFVTVDDLRDAAVGIKSEPLKQKLLDTALIYENYDAIIAEKFIDSTDRLTKLYYALEQHRYFDGKTVFIDSFKGFSGQQYKIIERIMAQAKDVTVTLTDNTQDKRDFALFSNVKKLKSKVSAIARSFGVGVLEDVVLDHKNYSSPELSALEDFMATGKTDFDGESPNITICSAENVYNETDFVARNIRRIVREEGARYSDFVIIARDIAPYEDALEIACKKNNISCFIDKRISLMTLPVATTVLAAANVAKNFSTENILRFYKSGIDVLSVDEISSLENYAYIWNIDGATWQKDWTMDPEGFNAKGELTEQKVRQLEYLNKLRQKAINPLIKLKNDFKNTAPDMARALVRLLDETNASKRFKNLYKQFESGYGDAIKQSWDAVMRILNSLAVCFGSEEISKLEFCDALKTALSLETVGIVPQMIDEAIFGAADRIRPSRPKYAFIMGANQGVFPRLPQTKGLFANDERKMLIEQNINIPDTVCSMAIEEESLLYSNVCCATDKVFISYANKIGTTACEPSSFVLDIKNKFKCKVCIEPSELSSDNLPESYEDAFARLCDVTPYNKSDAQTLLSTLDNKDYTDRIDSVMHSIKRTDFSISGDTARKLFGDKLYMSPSRFDTFSRCRFMYFCRYGLGIESLQAASFDTLQRGTIVHHVLQRIVEDYGKTISEFDEDKIVELIDKYTNEYLNMVVGYCDIETPYLKYLVTTIKRLLKYVVQRLALEFAQSDFEPVKCELGIGYEGGIPAISIPIDDEVSLELIGKVDRVDTWNGYVRIIDYKTGSREFQLPDILVGQNMQMLIYLYAIANSEEFGGNTAGILYMIAKRDKRNNKKNRRMNGLLAANLDLITAMEPQNKGEFVPNLDEDNPSSSFIAEEDFDKIFKFIENKLKQTGHAIYSGNIAAAPVDGLDSGACKYCEFKNVCRIGDEKIEKAPKLTNSEVMEIIESEVCEDGI
ncbi:MAG: PD-(D/E)XK nuclease family protein [Clostridia bacterium]|nr:PD-(D/E)XK nuclease family protein [Clostridia bacterium]